MADRTQKQRRGRRPLESYNRSWLGFGALAVVAVLIGAMLVVKVANEAFQPISAQINATLGKLTKPLAA